MMQLISSIFLIYTVVVNSAAAPALSIVTTSQNSKLPYVADYSGKVSVSVGSVLTQQEAANAAQIGYIRPRAPVIPRSVQNDPPPPVPTPPSLLQYDSLYVGGAGTQRPFRPWSPPPVNPDETFHQVNVHVFGEQINNSALHYLQPNLNPQTVAKLRVILGAEYDDAWMSPENPGSQSHAGYFPRGNDGLIEELNKMNFSLVDEDNLHQLEPKVVSTMKKWLFQKATCPIEYVWKDMGNRFWPQWIRHGVCKEKSGCSWPSGMTCQASGKKVIKHLRWYCSKETPEQERRRFRRNNYFRRSRRSLFGSAGSAFVSALVQQGQPLAFPANQNAYNAMGDRRGRHPQDKWAVGPHDPRRRFTREDRRSKRVKRLVRKLSRNFMGYHCEWQRDQYVLQPDCTCQC